MAIWSCGISKLNRRKYAATHAKHAAAISCPSARELLEFLRIDNIADKK